MQNQTRYIATIGGQAGQGIKSAGLMFSKLATRAGYHIYNHSEYPSLIRGGHNMMQINISSDEIAAPSQKIDLLIALNQDTINRHLEELNSGGGILFDEGRSLDTSKVSKEINLYPIPFTKLAADAGGKELLSNIVALGAATAITGADLSILKQLIADEFGSKGEEIVNSNHQAAQLGYEYVIQNFANQIKNILTKKELSTPTMIVNGNDTVAIGAIAAGMQFAAIYPMTPTSNILHIFSAYQEKYGFIYKQPEDEIAAINMAIGASFAGARALTATSGGGFCLMVEGYGLAGITEIPIVIIEGMRPGPATGLPTWTEQGDLQFILHAHQGDFPRIVLAPGDAKEALELTMQAFNLADKYQTPVVVIVDKTICENEQSFLPFDLSSYQINRGKITQDPIPDYKRYSQSEDGVSLRALPGSGNFFITNSDEHDEIGLSSEDAENRVKQMQKRMLKLTTAEKEDMAPPQLFGPNEADVTLVSWGSNKGSIIEALKQFDNVNFLHITWMNPFPTAQVVDILSKAKHLIGIECNYTAQFLSLIREKTGIEIADKMLKYDGRPFYPEEIADKIKSVLTKI